MSDPLPDDAVVVRGGLMDNLNRLLEQAESDEGRLSVFAMSIDGDPEAALLAACSEGKIPNNKVRVTTAGELRAAGFQIHYTPDEGCACHYDVSIGTLTLETVDAFSHVFAEPIKNPAKGGVA